MTRRSSSKNIKNNLCCVCFMTYTAAVDLDKPPLNFLPCSVSRVVTLNIPRGGAGPASACFSPTKHDPVAVTPTCLTSQRFEARSLALMGIVWHAGPTPLIFPSWNLLPLLRKKVKRVMSHDSLLVSVCTSVLRSSNRKYHKRKVRLNDAHLHMLWLCSSVRGGV